MTPLFQEPHMMSGEASHFQQIRWLYFSRTHEFDALEKIDMPGVRLIVNPGGTNERYLDASIKRATKVLHDDNRTIFEAIVAGKADLMITDSIEVKLQSRRNQHLCPAMPGQLLTTQKKGYLMPQDNALKGPVSRPARGGSERPMKRRSIS